jgi:hypothetical protein
LSWVLSIPFSELPADLFNSPFSLNKYPFTLKTESYSVTQD